MDISTGLVLVVCVLLAIYFVPTVVALVKGRRNTLAIFMMNLLLGWTFVGWAVALVWSLKVDESRQSQKLVDVAGKSKKPSDRPPVSATTIESKITKVVPVIASELERVQIRIQVLFAGSKINH